MSVESDAAAAAAGRAAAGGTETTATAAPGCETFGRLIAGHLRFREGRFPREQALYERLATTGQSPRVMVVACCDSRVGPENVFDAMPGDLFVVRNVANLVPPYEQGGGLHGVSAALEFAVLALKVRCIVVMGHSGCGGVKAQLEGEFDPDSGYSFLKNWMRILKPARDDVLKADVAPQARQRMLEVEGLRASLANLRSFPCVAEKERRGALSLHGVWFDIESGGLHLLDEETGEANLVR